MTDDVKTTRERLSHAMVSGNLKVAPNGVGDAEYLQALGMAAMRVNPAASAILRLDLVQDVRAFREMRTETIKQADRLNKRSRWGLAAKQVITVVDQALRHFVAPVCNKCLGLKYERIAGAPSLSPRPCSACKGTGRRPLMMQYREYVSGVLSWLEGLEGDLEWRVRSKMRPAACA